MDRFFGGVNSIKASRQIDPLTGLKREPMPNEIMQKQKALADAGEWEALALMNDYYTARSSRDPRFIQDASSRLQDFRNLRQAKSQRFAPNPYAGQSTQGTQPVPVLADSPVSSPSPVAQSPYAASQGGVKFVNKGENVGSATARAQINALRKKQGNNTPMREPFEVGEAAKRGRMAALDRKYPAIANVTNKGINIPSIDNAIGDALLGRMDTQNALDLATSRGWKAEYLRNTPTPYQVPAGVDITEPDTYSPKFRRREDQTLLNFNSKAARLAGRIAERDQEIASNPYLHGFGLKDNLAREFGGLPNSDATRLTGMVEDNTLFDEWRKRQAGYDRGFDAATARRKLMIDQLARSK